jgi:hypothetical protein
MPTTPSFVPLVALGESYTDCRCARKGWRLVLAHDFTCRGEASYLLFGGIADTPDRWTGSAPPSPQGGTSRPAPRAGGKLDRQGAVGAAAIRPATDSEANRTV